MLQHKSIAQLPNQIFESLGWDYYISESAKNYLVKKLVVISAAERDAFYEAGNRLYQMLIETGEFILKNNLLTALGIPKNLHEIIRSTWEDDRHLHLFGRFDFAGGVDGLPLKMLEFNADTPTSLPETAIIQWAQLKANNLPEEQQFNFVLEALTDNFRRLRELNPDREAAILFSTMRDAPEDDNNVQLLTEAAKEAGFETAFQYVDEVVFAEKEGIFANNNDGSYQYFPFWFKLVPWEYIADEEPELCKILTEINQRDLTIVLNPAYTMIFQSKAIMKYLYDLFPNEPLLLETSMKEPIGRFNYPYVKKVLFGREGANVSIHNEIGIPTEMRDGDYANQAAVYQEFATLAQDEDGQFCQAGVFFAFEACGLGFRRSEGRIMDNGAQFLGHLVV
jgi:glutathionylspermidine synthase